MKADVQEIFYTQCENEYHGYAKYVLSGQYRTHTHYYLNWCG